MSETKVTTTGKIDDYADYRQEWDLVYGESRYGENLLIIPRRLAEDLVLWPVIDNYLVGNVVVSRVSAPIAALARALFVDSQVQTSGDLVTWCPSQVGE